VEHLCYSRGVDDIAVQLDLFEPRALYEASAGDALASSAPQSGAPTTPRIVQCDDDFAELLRELEAAQRIAFDTETTGVDMTRCGLVGMSFCTHAGNGWYVPVDSVDDCWHLRPQTQQAQTLCGVLNRASAGLAAHNAKFDLGVLKQHHMALERVVYDTMLAQFAVDPFARGALGLKRLARDYLGWEMQEIESLIGQGKHQRSMRDVPVARVAPYAAADADATWQLVDVLQPKVSALGMDRLLNEVEFPLIPVLVDMELAGVAIDVPFLAQLSKEMTARLHQLEADIYKLAGRVFNVGSSQQLATVLYRILGLHVEVSSRSGNDEEALPSTRAHRLEALRDQHPIVPLVLEQRELAKLLGTYVDALPALVNPDTGRVHTHFNQAVVVTGRLSSSNPNLQNVPISTEMGRRVRQAFIGAPGGQVMSSDYSQVELRVLAHLANDVVLRAAFQRGEDIHKSTAAAVYHIPLAQVTAEQRAFAKHINFGIAYGMSAHSLARSTGMSDEQAEQFMADYFRRYSGVRRWLDATKRQVVRERYVSTMFGRRRPFTNLRDRSPSEVRRAERLAVNHPVQGTAAEVVKIAMIKLHHSLRAGGYHARLTLQVHDELVLDVPREEVNDVRELLRREMEQALPLSIPLKADVAVGDNWDSVA
jgi:DNA polymerase-1